MKWGLDEDFIEDNEIDESILDALEINEMDERGDFDNLRPPPAPKSQS